MNKIGADLIFIQFLTTRNSALYYSVASPFTSRTPDIRCILQVIRQGRAALVTSFGIFKFMVAYSLTEFLSVIILYSIDSNLTDLQFLFVDICLVVNFAFFFGKTQAYEGKLANSPPSTSLLSFTPLLSLILLMMVMILFQTLAFHAVKHFRWFVPFIYNADTGYMCLQNYSVFCVSMFQYITMAVVFSRGKPYRKPIYTNMSFIISILLLIVICAYITIYPASWIIRALELYMPPDYEWPFIILVIAVVNFLFCLFIESFVIEFLIEKKLRPKFYRPEKSKKKYLAVDYYLRNNMNWPKLSAIPPILSVIPSVENIANEGGKSCTHEAQSMINKKGKSVKLRHQMHIENGKSGIENDAFVDDEYDEKENVITRC